MIPRYVYEEIDSTNLEALRLAKTGGAIKAPFLVCAKKQTDGRGRSGRTWLSDEGGLFFSLYLSPRFEADKASMLTIVMVMAVAKAIKRYLSEQSLQADASCEFAIKWPNDIILNKKKVVGILTTLQLPEQDEVAGNGYGVVIGVGINTNQTNFAEELADKATSISSEIGISILDEILLKYIEEYFVQEYTTFEKEQTLSFLKEDYEAMLVNAGKQVRVLEPTGEYLAVAKGINDKGHLLVTKESGEYVEVYAGEVSVRGIYGYVD